MIRTSSAHINPLQFLLATCVFAAVLPMLHPLLQLERQVERFLSDLLFGKKKDYVHARPTHRARKEQGYGGFATHFYFSCLITIIIVASSFCNAQKTQPLSYAPANDPTGEHQYYLGVMWEKKLSPAGSSSSTADHHHHKEAIKWYQISAKIGYVHAQTHLGNIYRDGIIVKKSDKKALKWFSAAAVQKDNAALFSLGRMYELGTRATPKSFKKALTFYKKAAAKGHASSQYNLAAMYSRGDGVRSNNKIAEKYQLKAAAQGDTDAMFKLGLFEEFGANRRPSKKKALYWYTRALSFHKYNKLHGRELGYISVNKIKNKIQSLQPNYDPKSCPLPPIENLLKLSNSSSQQDRRKAIQLSKSIAKTMIKATKGSAVAQFEMGTIVYAGLRILGKKKYIYKKAIDWFKKAAQQGHHDAMFNLGIMTLQGEGVSKSYTIAYSWFQKCVQNGDFYKDGSSGIARCEQSLGDMHYLYDSSDPNLIPREIADAAVWDDARNRPIAFPKDLSIAFDYYTRAANKEHTNAMYSLAIMWARGHAGGGISSIDKASHWYLKAAQQGHAFSQTNLANVYYWGQSESHPFKQSFEKAAFWFKKSAASGDNYAQQTLGFMYMDGELEGSSDEDSLKQAKKWLKKSSEQGNLVAQFNLGLLYEDKERLNQPELAKHWYRKAAVQKNALSVTSDKARDVALSATFRYGLLCVASSSSSSSNAKEIKKGMKWLKKAAKNGHQNAKKKLKQLLKRERKGSGGGKKFDDSLLFDLWCPLSECK